MSTENQDADAELRNEQQFECMDCGYTFEGAFQTDRVYVDCPDCGVEGAEFRTEEGKKRLITDIESVLHRLQEDYEEAMDNMSEENTHRTTRMSGICDAIRSAKSYLRQLQEHRESERDHAILVEFDSGLPTETEAEQMREMFPDDYTVTEADR